VLKGLFSEHVVKMLEEYEKKLLHKEYQLEKLKDTVSEQYQQHLKQGSIHLDYLECLFEIKEELQDTTDNLPSSLLLLQ